MSGYHAKTHFPLIFPGKCIDCLAEIGTNAKCDRCLGFKRKMKKEKFAKIKEELKFLFPKKKVMSLISLLRLSKYFKVLEINFREGGRIQNSRVMIEISAKGRIRFYASDEDLEELHRILKKINNSI